jgi:hypothetical protein
MPSGNSSSRSCDRGDEPTVEVVRGKTASGAQRNPVGLRYRGAVARTAREISAVADLPSPLPAVGAGGQAGAHLAGSGGGVASARKTAAGGGLYRRLLHGGKKGASRSGQPRAARGRKSSLSPMITVFLSPLVSKVLRRTKVSFVEGLIGHSFLDRLRTRLIGDKAYDSDRLDRDLAERYGIEMIAPHR